MNEQKPAEIWKDVVGYEGLYQVSSEGDIRRLAGTPKCITSRLLTPHLTSGGYLFVVLCKNGKSRNADVHRLVAAAFLGPQPKGTWVNHIDGNKLNNHPSNLEYVTPSENIQHAYRLGLQPSRAGEGNGHAKLTYEQVRQIRQWAREGISRKVIAERTGMSKTAIRDVIVGSSWRGA